MLRYILNNLAGYLRIRVEGYSPERFLNLCCYHGIFALESETGKRGI